MNFKPRSEFLNVMQARGFLQDCTDLEGLDHLLRKQAVPAYIGFDATADSLHVGSLIQIMMLRWLQRTGHRPIVLMGGGTTKIGDPSGKDETRKLISHKEIDRNILGIRKVFEVYLDFGNAPTAAVILDNAEWLDELKYIDFLRDFGPPLHGQQDADVRLGAKPASNGNSRSRSSSSTTCCFRRTTSWNSTAVSAACCRWAGPTSGATS